MFDFDKMMTRCNAPEGSFIEEGELLDDQRLLVFVDNGADVLGVAHLDSVNSNTAFAVGRSKLGFPTAVWSPKLDNRLGAYILLDLLPKLGVSIDVLLTTDEELLNSTGSWFEPLKDYNWMFSFDREGSDAVMYHYESRLLKQELARYGFEAGVGSYSCIADMWHLGCRGINFGNGTFGGHSASPVAYLPMTASSVTKFLAFYHDNRHTTWKYHYNADDVKWLDQVGMPDYEDIDDDIAEDVMSYYTGYDEIAWCDICGGSIDPDKTKRMDYYDATLCHHCARQFGWF